ncbi:MAG: acyl-CoA thioesterase [Endomicrobium sp.]|jgi:acyl-CoA thioester hydrolase|nr:acyl-CoA thioesterase [Endomicrobium sp.]
MKEQYFKQNPQDPQPLSVIIERKVRFDELDPLNIMWHGNYASFFEDGRVALGNKYNIGYLDFYNRGITIPLKKFHIDFIAPLEFDKTYTIETLLHWNEAARLDFSFSIYDENQKFMTSGYCIQLMIDVKNGILVAKPQFFEEFCKKWKEGAV